MEGKVLGGWGRWWSCSQKWPSCSHTKMQTQNLPASENGWWQATDQQGAAGLSPWLASGAVVWFLYPDRSVLHKSTHNAYALHTWMGTYTCPTCIDIWMHAHIDWSSRLFSFLLSLYGSHTFHEPQAYIMSLFLLSPCNEDSTADAKNAVKCLLVSCQAMSPGLINKEPGVVLWYLTIPTRKQ